MLDTGTVGGFSLTIEFAIDIPKIISEKMVRFRVAGRFDLVHSLQPK